MDFDRIRGNVKRMIDQGAPESDIDAYLGVEGVSADQLKSGTAGGNSQASPQGRDRSAWTPEMRKGYDDYVQFQKDYNLPQEGSATLAANSASFGFADELSAAVKAGAGALYDFTQGQSPQFSKRYDEAWGGEQARLDLARKNAWMGGVPADIAGGLTVGPGKAAGGAVNQIKGLREAASESAKLGAAYSGAYGVGADDSGTLSGRAEAGAKSAAAGYLIGRAVPNVIAGGQAVYNRGIRQPLENYRGRVAARANKAASDFQEAGINPDEVFGPALVDGGAIDGTSTHLAGTIFGGPLRESARRSVQAIEGRIADEVAAAGGRQSSAEAGENIQSMLRQSLKERSIPSEQIKQMDPAQLQDVSGVAPGPKFDPPPPVINPIPPRQIRPQTAEDVLRAAEMDVQEPLRLLPPARKPNYPKEETPRYQTPKFEDIPEPPELVKEREALISMYDEAKNQHNALMRGEAQIINEVNAAHQTAGVEGSRMVGGKLRVKTDGREYTWNGRTLEPPRSAPRPDLAVYHAAQSEQKPRGIFEAILGRKHAPEPPPAEPSLPEIKVSNDQAMALQRLGALQKSLAERSSMIDSLAVQARNVRAAIDSLENKIESTRSRSLGEQARAAREAENARVEEANQSLPQRRAEAERVARELSEQDRRIAQEQYDTELAARREQARKAASKNADELAAKRTEQMQRESEAEARRATQERQAQVDAEHAADLNRRREQASQEFELGNTAESIPTQLDAAYEQVARNAPAIQRNPLGQKNEPGRTRTAQLLDEFGQEARRNMKLKGYRSGQIFDDNGGIRPDLLEYLDEHLGKDVAGRIRAFSEARARGAFVPSVQGLRDMRTAIGRAMEDAKRAKYASDGNTRTADEAMLARLYDALSQDVQTFLRSAGPDGELAARQMMQVDGEYKRYLRDLRMPLSKLFGDNVAPEQAIATLRRATRMRDGDTRLLERFYLVASARGDRLRATNSILQSILDDGLATFLKDYRSISPEAHKIMFSGGAKQFGEALDRIAKAGGHLERYIELAGREPRLRQTVSNPGNIMAVLSGFLHVPTAMLGIVGATATSRVLASKAFNQWVRRAPTAIKTSQEWRRHVYRLRGILMAQGGMSKEAGNSLLQALLPPEEPKSVKMPSVVPRYKTRQDVIERLQYEAN